MDENGNGQSGALMADVPEYACITYSNNVRQCDTYFK
jgi:hypothetical protein